MGQKRARNSLDAGQSGLKCCVSGEGPAGFPLSGARNPAVAAAHGALSGAGQSDGAAGVTHCPA